MIQRAHALKINQFLMNLFITFTMTLILITFLSIILFKLHQLYFPLENLDILQAKFLGKEINAVQPKPDERFAFITMLLLLPILSYGLIKFTLSISHKNNHFLQFLTKVSICIFTALIIAFMYSSDFIMLVIPNIYQQSGTILCLSIFCLYGCYRLQKNPDLKSSSRKDIFFISSLIIISILLQSFSFRILSLSNVNGENNWVYHFGAVFYSVAQVFAGKTVLVHLPAQYGLYAELLNPLFKLIGLSVFKFSIVMAILQITSLITLFIFQMKIMHYKILICISMLTLCLITGFTWNFIGSPSLEVYYQYYPLRFFFPCIFVLSMFSFVKVKNLKKLILLSLLSSLAIIWNIESGIAIFGALIAYIGSFIVFPSQEFNRRSAIKFILYAVNIFLISIILFGFYLFFKSGHSLNLSLIFKYPSIFYKAGYAMLPISKMPDPWQIILAIYVFGIIGAVLNWINKRRPLHWEVIFYSSIMGLGLFVYFEGRSHPVVLILVSWPAILISFLLTDLAFRLARLQLISKVIIALCYPIFLFGLLATVTFMSSFPKLLKSGWDNSKLINSNKTEISRNIAFIKSHLNGKKEVAILASNQAVYYGELGLASSVTGPGLIEILLKSDLEELQNQLKNNTDVVFYQPNTNVLSGMYNLGNALDSYRVVATSPDNMQYLVKNK